MLPNSKPAERTPSATPEVLELDPESGPTYETSAKFLARLVLPAGNSSPRRSKLENALCYHALCYEFKTYPEENDTPIEMKPRHVFVDQESQRKNIKFVQDRLGERLIAGRMAAGLLQRSEQGSNYVRPAYLKRLSVNQLAELAYAKEGYKGPENIPKRFWRPSRAVIHMAAALAVTGQEWARSGVELSFLQLLFDSELMKTVVVRSQNFADLIAQDSQFPVKHEALIQIRIKTTD